MFIISDKNKTVILNDNGTSIIKHAVYSTPAWLTSAQCSELPRYVHSMVNNTHVTLIQMHTHTHMIHRFNCSFPCGFMC